MSSRLAILRRDKWTCRMPACLHTDETGETDRRIDPELTPASPWAGTVDHIVPRSLGGTDRAGNLRAAHRRCNQAAANGLHDGVRSRRKAPKFRQEPLSVDRRDPRGRILQDPYDRIRQAERDSWPQSA